MAKSNGIRFYMIAALCAEWSETYVEDKDFKITFEDEKIIQLSFIERGFDVHLEIAEEDLDDEYPGAEISVWYEGNCGQVTIDLNADGSIYNG